MPNGSPAIPNVTNEDIDWVCRLLRLDDLDAPRCAFLTSGNTLDVSACPGSGKTTLIVAKLAILARKWPCRTRGICVLSHTNAAREELQRRLGSTIIGQRLLSYPHFIDTIHGFVNRFLALPWLRSNGFPSPTIDDDVTNNFRIGVIGSKYWKVQGFLEKRGSGFEYLRITTRDLCFDLCGKRFPAAPSTESFKLAKLAVETSAKAGYFCYDEMFVWARALLEDYPAAASWLRCRFPYLIIDEMQDTFDVQGTILHALFPRTSSDIVVQRVGDLNQAIFEDASEPNLNDPYPDPDASRSLGIPNSYRFGPAIAAFASPFAVTSVGTNGLSGIGPKAPVSEPSACRHAIFIFPSDSTAGVLDSYGKHVLTIFNDEALAGGVVTAVGAVHHDALEIKPGHKHFPKSVPHYWSKYTSEICKNKQHPNKLVQYFRAAQTIVRECCNLWPGVERIASGIIRLAAHIGSSNQLKCKARNHHAIVDALSTDAAALAVYRKLVKTLLMDRMPLTEEHWREMQANSLAVACALCEGITGQVHAGGFLEWSETAQSFTVSAANAPCDTGPNIYRVVDGNRYVDIRLGSIHSVKGQTHLATMVLNTYWNGHSSQRMLPWLLGTRLNDDNAGIQDRKRLVQTYVAMTRPSHLICFAIPRFVFGDDDPSAHVATLIGRGWCVAELVDGTPRWITHE